MIFDQINIIGHLFSNSLVLKVYMNSCIRIQPFQMSSQAVWRCFKARYSLYTCFSSYLLCRFFLSNLSEENLIVSCLKFTVPLLSSKQDKNKLNLRMCRPEQSDVDLRRC